MIVNRFTVPVGGCAIAADEISKIGVYRILQRIERPETCGAPYVTLIEPELVVRASSGSEPGPAR